MSDYLVNLSRKPVVRQTVQSLGLPVPMPQALRRPKGSWLLRPLSGRLVAHAADPNAELHERVLDTIGSLGASAIAGASLGDEKVHGLVFDASGVATIADLEAVYAFFHDTIRQLDRCGRVVVIGRAPSEAPSAEAAAARHALEGFTRSLAKEIGRKGATAVLLEVGRGGDTRMKAALRFLLSDRPAFVSGQVVRVSKTAKGAASETFTLPLQGRVALVTGAGRGIGRATAKRLAQEGARVVVLEHPSGEDAARSTARDIAGLPLLVDVSAPDAPEIIATFLREQCGGVDVVVHNAGVTRDKTLAKMDEDRWRQALDINLGAVLRITDRLLDDGVLRDDGRIVVLSSVGGIAGNFGQTNYAASKSGLIGWVEAMAPELGKRSITVNAVAPGLIETKMTAKMPFLTREGARRLSNLGQGGEPVDIAEVITFLASPGAIGVTGTTLRVCGGALIGA